ncbi:tetratricopeptide repeat protein [Sphingomonas profundi]|uniref:tetratricopeptide repeat protein n=1 Tax=Alterirhizorhabdus profundi TaxID=2681549 RepID=UPI0012E861DC|nr:tetratricopeptide repeat protein [Sphingomonas profundi]
MRAYGLGLIAVALIASAGEAAVREEAGSPYARYMRARAADAAGRTEAAARGYAAVLAESPDDTVLALRTFRQAIAAGDRPLAVRTARMLDAKGLLPSDGRLLLLSEAVLLSDWKGATQAIDRIEAEGVYGFAVPVLRAWIAQSSKSGDPVAALDAAQRGGAIAIAYAAEHRALIALATGRTADGVAAIRAQAGGLGGRAVRLRLAAAAILAKRGDRAGAQALLAGDDTALTAARRLLAAGRPLPGAITDAAGGIAELLARTAIDINRERVTPVSLTLARLSTFLAPENAETWLVTSEILSAAEQYDAALAAVAEVKPTDPFAEAARFARVQLLVRRGETDKALGEALVEAKAPDATAEDWVRVGQLQNELEHHAEAADAFGRALALNDAAGNKDRWSLLLQRGGALDRAGDWPQAKALLEEAVRIAPDQASALNYLGYAQLERRINLPAAEQLIERASRLRPDDAAITDSLGWTYFLRGDVPKAIATLEAAVASEPSEPTINEHLGDAYWTIGRRYEARYAWRAALVFAEEKDAARIRAKIDTGWSQAVAAP